MPLKIRLRGGIRTRSYEVRIEPILQASRPSPSPSPAFQAQARPQQRPSPRYAQLSVDVLSSLAALALAWGIRDGLDIPPYIPGGEPPDPYRYVLAAPVLFLTVVTVFA